MEAKFVTYYVEGCIKSIDSKGKTTFSDHCSCRGTVANGNDMLGKIMRQNENLRMCNVITRFNTHPIAH